MDVQDNMSNVSEERSARQQNIKKGLQFIEYDFVVLFLYASTCMYMRWRALGKPWDRAPAEEGGGHVFLLRVFANMNMEMENSLTENTDSLFVLKPSRWRVGGYSFSAFEKNQQ